MPLHLICLFLIVAALYAAVGFGGGSTYNALLVLHGTDFRILPAIALACNIIVVSGGLLRFAKEELINPRALMPFLIASIPAAWIGGQLPVTETVFIGLLGSALLLSGLRLMLQKDFVYDTVDKKRTPLVLALISGGGIGLISGLVGIGGGIFLAPVLYWLRWDTPRKIAAACSLFILINSMSGLSGQVIKLSNTDLLSLAVPYWPLLPAVFVGGQLGSWMASKRLEPAILKLLTAVLILYVAARLIFKWLGLVGFLG